MLIRRRSEFLTFLTDLGKGEWAVWEGQVVFG